ncbi:MAG: ABC transporter permease [Pararhodobacter sp.]|nr:ABC transporter permease [Pararhodobacter sp.]
MDILYYIIRQLLYAAVMLTFTSLTIFLLINSLGNPVALMLADTPGVSPETVARISALYGLDEPLWKQYFIWIANALRFEFGTSITYNLPVRDMIANWGLRTARIQIPAIVIAVAIAVVAGTYAARRQGTRRDLTVRGLVLLGQLLPAFFLGILLIWLFSYTLGWFPSYGAISTRNLLWGSPLLDILWHMVMPVTMLAFFNIATLTLLVRTNMIDVLRQDFVKTARASGVSESVVIRRHALRMAALPVVTYTGMLLGLMLGTAPVTETVFTWPGLGALYVSAIIRIDYPLIMGISIVIASMLIVITTLTDILYAVLDPRVTLT